MIPLIQKYWYYLTITLLISIALLSLWPAAQLPSVPGSDKTHHFIGYAALILPVALRQPKYFLIIVIGFLAFSGAIELIQPYVNRYGEWLDMLANTIGLICGWLLAKLMLLFTQKKHVNLR